MGALLGSPREAGGPLRRGAIVNSALAIGIIHGYYDVSVEIVWKTAREDIPPLRKRCFGFSTPLGAISGCRLTAEA